jgi:sulfatase modifying factor 1
MKAVYSRVLAAIALALLVACARAPQPEPAHAAAAPTVEDTPRGMVWIPGGRYLMGGDDEHAADAERPVHPVVVDGFFMDAHTITNAEFRAFVAATRYVTVAERAPSADEILAQLPPGTPPPDPALLVPGSVVFAPSNDPVDLRDPSAWWRWTPGADWRHPDGPGSDLEGKDDFPVVQIAWEDAQAYLHWAGKRLPTEAEWEFAARGGRAHTRYTWGDAEPDPANPQAHIYAGVFPTHPAGPRPVGSFPSTGYGLYDMAGNVWQWTSDWYRQDTYALDLARGEVRNPGGPTTGVGPPLKVLRGGSFLCNDSYCRGYRVSARSPADPASGASHIGFRGVMSREQWRARRGS